MPGADVGRSIAGVILILFVGCGGEKVTTSDQVHGDSSSGGSSSGGSGGPLGDVSSFDGNSVASDASENEVADASTCECFTGECAAGSHLVPGAASALCPNCQSCVPCGVVNCPMMAACAPGQEPVLGPGECCPTSCKPAAGSCIGTPCSNSRGCCPSDGGAPPLGIACGASGTCEACTKNGLNDICLAPNDSPAPDCCAGLKCVNNRCVR
jgi:hypothetical protein